MFFSAWTAEIWMQVAYNEYLHIAGLKKKDKGFKRHYETFCTAFDVHAAC